MRQEIGTEDADNTADVTTLEHFAATGGELLDREARGDERDRFTIAPGLERGAGARGLSV
jgi:hypothetical protein